MRIIASGVLCFWSPLDNGLWHRRSSAQSQTPCSSLIATRALTATHLSRKIASFGADFYAFALRLDHNFAEAVVF
jgi:hypothetical protein